MSYRSYLAVIPKKEVEEIGKLCNRSRLLSWMSKKKYLFDYRFVTDEGCVNFFDVLQSAKEAMEVDDFTHKLFEQKGEQLFKGDLQEAYSDYNVRVVNDPFILEQIKDNWKEKVREYYQNLLNGSEQFIKHQINLKYISLSMTYEMPRQDKIYSVTYNDDYEYAIFNINYLKKVYNPDKESLIVYGY